MNEIYIQSNATAVSNNSMVKAAEVVAPKTVTTNIVDATSRSLQTDQIFVASPGVPIIPYVGLIPSVTNDLLTNTVPVVNTILPASTLRPSASMSGNPVQGAKG